MLVKLDKVLGYYSSLFHHPDPCGFPACFSKLQAKMTDKRVRLKLRYPKTPVSPKTATVTFNLPCGFPHLFLGNLQAKSVLVISLKPRFEKHPVTSKTAPLPSLPLTSLNKACKLRRRVNLEVLFGLGYATFPLVKVAVETSHTQDVMCHFNKSYFYDMKKDS